MVVAIAGDMQRSSRWNPTSPDGFTAPIVFERVPMFFMVLVNPMCARPGDAAGEWWEHTPHAEARSPTPAGG